MGDYCVDTQHVWAVPKYLFALVTENPYHFKLNHLVNIWPYCFNNSKNIKSHMEYFSSPYNNMMAWSFPHSQISGCIFLGCKCLIFGPKFWVIICMCVRFDCDSVSGCQNSASALCILSTNEGFFPQKTSKEALRVLKRQKRHMAWQ